MEIWQHFLVSTVIAIMLYPFFGIAALLTYVGGVLVDIDHPLEYLFKYKSLNLKKSYNYYRGMDLKAHIKTIRIFHNIEFIAIIAIISFLNNTFIPILIGLVLHIVMDIIAEKKIYKKAYNYSIIRLLKRKVL